jgi:hypothetical protein
MNIRLAFATVFALLLCPAVFAQSATRDSGIRGVDFRNYNYESSSCSEDLGTPRTIKVVGGKFRDGDNYYNVVGKVVYGDLNADGREDAAVRIDCGSAAGTLRDFEVQVFTLRDGRPALLSRLDSHGVEADHKKFYRGGFVVMLAASDLKVVKGHLILEALTDGSNASPKYVSTFDYKLRGRRFVLSGRPRRRPNRY